MIFLAITTLNFAVARSIPTTSYATGIEELLTLSYFIAAISTPQAIVVGVLEQNAKVSAELAKKKEKEVASKLKLADKLKLQSQKSASDSPSSHKIPIVQFDSESESAPDLPRQPSKAPNLADALSRALSKHFTQMAEQPKEIFNFSYKSRAAMIIDRTFYYGFLLTTIIAFSLFFSGKSLA